MAKRSLIDQLDQAVDAILVRPGAVPSADPALAELLRIAGDLRHLPSPDFKLRLKADLQGRAAMPTSTAEPVRELRTITPYLIVARADEMLDFVKEAFGAEGMVHGIGSAGGIHAEARIGDSLLMLGGGGAGATWQGTPMPSAIHLYVPDVDAVYRRALATGATSLRPPADQEYGDRDASIKDAFGNHWYIATHLGAHYIPEGLHSVNLYLHPQGADKLVDFLQRAFAAEEVLRHQTPDGVVHHAKVRIGDTIVEMGEAHAEFQNMPTAVFLSVTDADAVYRRALEAGATSLFPPDDKPYGRTGGVQDYLGNHWYMSTQIKDAEK